MKQREVDESGTYIRTGVSKEDVLALQNSYQQLQYLQAQQYRQYQQSQKESKQQQHQQIHQFSNPLTDQEQYIQSKSAAKIAALLGQQTEDNGIRNRWQHVRQISVDKQELNSSTGNQNNKSITTNTQNKLSYIVPEIKDLQQERIIQRLKSFTVHSEKSYDIITTQSFVHSIFHPQQENSPQQPIDPSQNNNRSASREKELLQSSNLSTLESQWSKMKKDHKFDSRSMSPFRFQAQSFHLQSSIILGNSQPAQDYQNMGTSHQFLGSSISDLNKLQQNNCNEHSNLNNANPNYFFNSANNLNQQNLTNSITNCTLSNSSHLNHSRKISQKSSSNASGIQDIMDQSSSGKKKIEYSSNGMKAVQQTILNQKEVEKITQHFEEQKLHQEKKKTLIKKSVPLSKINLELAKYEQQQQQQQQQQYQLPQARQLSGGRKTPKSTSSSSVGTSLSDLKLQEQKQSSPSVSSRYVLSSNPTLNTNSSNVFQSSNQNAIDNFSQFVLTPNYQQLQQQSQQCSDLNYASSESQQRSQQRFTSEESAKNSNYFNPISNYSTNNFQENEVVPTNTSNTILIGNIPSNNLHNSMLLMGQDTPNTMKNQSSESQIYNFSSSASYEKLFQRQPAPNSKFNSNIISTTKNPFYDNMNKIEIAQNQIDCASNNNNSDQNWNNQLLIQAPLISSTSLGLGSSFNKNFVKNPQNQMRSGNQINNQEQASYHQRVTSTPSATNLLPQKSNHNQQKLRTTSEYEKYNIHKIPSQDTFSHFQQSVDFQIQAQLQFQSKLLPPFNNNDHQIKSNKVPPQIFHHKKSATAASINLFYPPQPVQSEEINSMSSFHNNNNNRASTNLFPSSQSPLSSFLSAPQSYTSGSMQPQIVSSGQLESSHKIQNSIKVSSPKQNDLKSISSRNSIFKQTSSEQTEQDHPPPQDYNFFQGIIANQPQQHQNSLTEKPLGSSLNKIFTNENFKNQISHGQQAQVNLNNLNNFNQANASSSNVIQGSNQSNLLQNVPSQQDRNVKQIIMSKIHKMNVAKIFLKEGEDLAQGIIETPEKVDLQQKPSSSSHFQAISADFGSSHFIQGARYLSTNSLSMPGVKHLSQIANPKNKISSLQNQQSPARLYNSQMQLNYPEKSLNQQLALAQSMVDNEGGNICLDGNRVLKENQQLMNSNNSETNIPQPQQPLQERNLFPLRQNYPQASNLQQQQQTNQSLNRISSQDKAKVQDSQPLFGRQEYYPSRTNNYQSQPVLSKVKSSKTEYSSSQKKTSQQSNTLLNNNSLQKSKNYIIPIYQEDSSTAQGQNPPSEGAHHLQEANFFKRSFPAAADTENKPKKTFSFFSSQ